MSAAKELAPVTRRRRAVLSMALATAAWWALGCDEITGSGSSYEEFRDDGRVLGAPAGWKVTDPFTTKTPYNTHYYCGINFSKDVALALLKSGDGRTQVWVAYGPAELLDPKIDRCLAEKEKNVMVRTDDSRQVKTADGTDVEMLIAHWEEGLAAGERVEMIHASGRKGSDRLVLSAGSLDLDVDLIEAIIESIKI